MVGIKTKKVKLEKKKVNVEITGKICLTWTLVYNARFVIYGIKLSARRFPTICLNFEEEFWYRLVLQKSCNKSMAKVLQTLAKMQERQNKLESRHEGGCNAHERLGGN